MSVVLSLDCEILWGVSDFASENYIKSNIKNADKTLWELIDFSEKCGISSQLYIAFVQNSLDFQTYSNGWSFSEKTINKALASECKLGLHSTDHKLYSKMNHKDYESEIKKIKAFINKNEKFSRFFVFPKNQIHISGSKDIFKVFEKVRVNSDSWLYGSIGKDYNILKRILRYIDSFFPIYELCCSKKPEIDLENAIVGTHFFRANLDGFLLHWHYKRLEFGRYLMKKMKKDMHIWSHPHNFNGNEKAIKLFINLGNYL